LVLPDNNLHIVFCDVGQGDAILLSYKSTQLLVDTGYDGKVLECLADHIPFFDKQLEMVMITHPQQDHIGGLSKVMESYSVLQIVIPPAHNPIQSYKQLQQQLEAGRIKVSNIYTFDKLVLGNVMLNTVWPTREFVKGHTASQEARVLGWMTDGTDLNSFSIVMKLTYGNFDLLLTGDADHQVQLAQLTSGLLTDIDVLKVPHHGGKQAILPSWIDVIKPEIAVISAGVNNSYGHPRKETLDILSDFRIRTIRTDLDGTIELVSNGKAYWLK
jgi:competence protein ComEC